ANGPAPASTALAGERAGAATAVLAGAGPFARGLLLLPGGPAPRGAARALDGVLAAAAVAWSAAVLAGTAGPASAAATVVAAAFLARGRLTLEASAPGPRRRGLWLLLGLCGSVPPTLLVLIASDGTGVGPVPLTVVLGAASLVLPGCVVLAAADPPDLDVRVVASRGVASVVAVLLAVAAFSGAAAVADLVGRPAGPGTLALLAALVAAGFHPVLLRVRGVVDEVLFGGRVDAVRTLALLGPELSGASDPQAWLATLRVALAVPAVELRAGSRSSASPGPLPAHAPRVEVELRAGGDVVGVLLVALAPGTRRLAPATRVVVQLLAGPLGQAAHATRLAEDLRASRARVLAVLEDERRRVRRDLHDGLGPTLTGIAYSADATANLLHGDPAGAAAVLAGLRTDAADAIAEVRRIVDGLRPRALDERGLVEAVRQQVSRLHAADGRRLHVRLRAPDVLPDLPAVVEVVAYRVAVEAVTNVARHAGVDEVDVRFAVAGGALVVEVRDRGAGRAAWAVGTGLGAMRERVEEVGGELHAAAGEAGGVVRAVVPLAAEAPAS
ncbi:hypothetical protein GTR02_05880, partial [Kineococcus sp. R8]|uniref:sensor histidine kinase n=1 Tax=Kineococcus siccus TaxID=2696567 RepID=UPI001413045F